MKRGGACDFIPLAYRFLLKIELLVLFFTIGGKGILETSTAATALHYRIAFKINSKSTSSPVCNGVKGASSTGNLIFGNSLSNGYYVYRCTSPGDKVTLLYFSDLTKNCSCN